MADGMPIGQILKGHQSPFTGRKGRYSKNRVNEWINLVVVDVIGKDHKALLMKLLW